MAGGMRALLRRRTQHRHNINETKPSLQVGPFAPEVFLLPMPCAKLKLDTPISDSRRAEETARTPRVAAKDLQRSHIPDTRIALLLFIARDTP